MAWKLEIDGVDRTAQIKVSDEVTIDKTLNSRSLAGFVCRDGYTPNRFEEVSIYADDGVTKDFGGIIVQRRGREIEPSHGSVFTEIDCVDYSFYADVTFASLSYPEPTAVEDIIEDLAELLVPFGITYTPTATGLTLAGVFWQNARVSDALRQINEATQLVFIFLPTKELIAFVPGSTAAPVSMTDATPNCLTVNWSDSDDIPYNRVVLECGPTGSAPAPRMEWIADGVVTDWVTDLPAADPPPILVLIDDGVSPYLATVGTNDPGGMYYWDRDTHTLSLGIDTPPAAGTRIILGTTQGVDAFFSEGTYYTAQYPFTVTKSTGATPVLAAFFKDETIVSLAQGNEVAQGLLDQLGQDPRKLAITTLVSGFEPGQSLTMGLTSKAVGDYLIMSVSKVRDSNAVTYYSLDVTESSVYQPTALDNWREKLSDGSGGGGITASVGGGFSGLTGSGTVNKVPRFSGATSLANSQISDDGTDVTLGGTVKLAGTGGAGHFLKQSSAAGAVTSAVPVSTDIDGVVSSIQQQIDNKLWHPLVREYSSFVFRPSVSAIDGMFLPTTSISTPAGSQSNLDEAGFTGRRFTTGATSGNAAGFAVNSQHVRPIITDWVAYFRVRTGSDITSLRLFVGLSKTEPGDTDSQSNLVDHVIAMFRYSTVAGDGGWRGMTFSGLGGAQSLSNTVAAIAASTEYLLRIRVSGNGTAIHFSVDGSAEQTITTNLPPTDERMAVTERHYTQTGATRSFDFNRFYIEYHAGNRSFTEVVR